MKILYKILVLLLFTYVTFTQNVYRWYQVPSGTTNNLYSYTYNSSGYSFISGTTGTILRSYYGDRWILLNSGTDNDLKCIYSSGSSFFISGANGTILKSTNNGTNWSGLNTGVTSDLNSLTLLFYTSIIAVGNSGTIIYSTNSGQTWIQKTGITTSNLNACSYISSSFNFFDWIVGDNGTILKSTNSGGNWINQNSGVSEKLNGLQIKDADNIWVVGNNGKILKTSNGGQSWMSVPTGTNTNLKSIFINQFGFGWISGSSGTLFRTTNNGLNWTLQSPPTNTDLSSVYCNAYDDGIATGNNGVIIQRLIDTSYLPYTFLDGNNINSMFFNTGIFDQDRRTSNTPGLEWPKGTGQYAIFTAGLSVSALYNGELRMGTAFYGGEYLPGYVLDSSGIAVGKTDSTFKFYKVKRGDNINNSIDWANWGFMVPYGAPFTDVNHDGVYEPDIDTPGVKNAVQTIFICLTDAFPESHSVSEGFGGGTLPLYSEVHLTAWCYDTPELMDVQFIKWNVINKSHVPWNGTYFTLGSDPDLGCADDDYIGCDSTRSLGFCYNCREVDCASTYRYTGIVPSVGFQWLQCPGVRNMGITSITYVGKASNGFPMCEREPNPGALNAYNFMKGYKGDLTPWVIPPGGPQNITEYCYSGDPESGTGWCEAQSEITGRVDNCGGPGVTIGNIINTTNGGDRRIILNSGSDNLTVNPGDTQKILIAQLIARGISRRNSVTRLKILADTVKSICTRGFLTGLDPVVSSIPSQFQLFQNYPNPFNPATKIKFTIPFNVSNYPRVVPEEAPVTLKVYDVIGREVATLINDNLKSGTYEIIWNGANYASGVYFYRLKAGSYTATKKMVLVK